MYVTTPLSHLQKFPRAVSDYPEGPNSGYLVIKDEESETYSCLGLCKNQVLKELPFPQNKELTLRYAIRSGQKHLSRKPVFLIPVLNQPLPANRYYAIIPHGKHKGEALTCSTEDDRAAFCFCFCRCVRDVKSRPLDPQNIYQQFVILPYKSFCSSRGHFTAKSKALDGFPPGFFRGKRWRIFARTPKRFKLEEARGRDYTICPCVPQLTFTPLEPVVVGKWYCPFMFVKDGRVRDQVERSMYYEMTLEQRWERIFTGKRSINKNNSVVVEVVIEKEEAFVDGKKAVNTSDAVDGVIWFTSPSKKGGKMSFGLREEIFQRMRWEQERSGWIGGEEREVKIKKSEEFMEGGKWREFGCYVLVERFNLKRMDGSLAMAYDFKHCHQIRTKWKFLHMQDMIVGNVIFLVIIQTTFDQRIQPDPTQAVGHTVSWIYKTHAMETPLISFLVLQDEDQYVSYCCFGLCKEHILNKLPFPQNKELCFRSWSPAPLGEVTANVNPVLLIPVIDQPLSSNRYYAIVPHGKQKGKAYGCSTEADKSGRGYVSEFNPQNIYQQFDIVGSGSHYKVKSIASNGFPPSFPQVEGWMLHAKTPRCFTLGEAKGVDYALRARLPLDLSQEPVEVGKWYCPFIFVKEGRIKDQVKRSMHYEMTLEQRWEKIFTCRKNAHDDPRKPVAVEAVIEKEEVFVGGVHKAGVMVIWYTSSQNEGEFINIGLRVEIFRRGADGSMGRKRK